MPTRILLSDGSGLTSRQVATILAQSGYEVHVLCARGPSLTRWTRWVTKVHNVTPFGSSPYEWLRAAIETAKQYDIDTLIPTQEQVAVLSAEAESLTALGIGLVVPSFEALCRVMDKISAYKTLEEAGIRQPESVAISSPEDVRLHVRAELVPCFVKTPIGTASKGVALARSFEDLARVVQEFEGLGIFQDGGQVLVQRAVVGPLLMVQSVFFRGNLLSWHACLRAREGPSGGAANKISLPMASVKDDLVRLGAFLKWNGALSMDAILVGGVRYYIDVNPRVVEPVNALYSGVDLMGSMLQIARLSGNPESRNQGEDSLIVQAPGREQIRTHQFVLAALKAVESGRLALLREVINAMLGRNQYANSREELTPIRGDVLSLVFLVCGTTLLFLGGRSLARLLERGSVSNYAITPKGWQAIVDAEARKKRVAPSLAM